MKYNVPLPRVLDANGNELRRLNIIDASVSLSLVPLSTAQIMLPIFENLNVRDWVQMYTSQGSAGVFRVRAPGQNYRMESKQYALDHGIVEVGDYIVSRDTDFNAPANTIISSIFSYYKGSLWVLGTVAPTETVQYSVNYEDVLTALMGVVEQLPDYMMQFDQSVVPWRLNIIRKPQTVTGEGRLSRNVVSARISEDDNSLCTRIISPDLPNGKLEADTISIYGVVEKYIGKDEDQDQAIFVSDCNKYLAQHKKPLLSVNLELRDLEQITGESIDGITVGDLYRLALPDYNTTIEQPVISLVWRSVYGDPGAINVTLANEEITMSSAFHNAIGGGGGLSSGGSGSSQSLAKTNQKIIREEVKLRETKVVVDNAVEYLDEAWVEIDAHGVEIGAQKRTTDLLSEISEEHSSKLSVQAEKIEGIVEKTGINSLGEKETIYSKITQTANDITSEVNKKVDKTTYQSYITQTADLISSKVSSTDYNGNTIASLINQTATTITISASKINLSGYVTASQLSATTAKIDNLMSGDTTAAFLKANQGNIPNMTIGNLLTFNGHGVYWQGVTIGGTNYHFMGYVG